MPLIKRATGRLSDGRSVAMWISANSGDDPGDGTGVAKIYVWLSDDSFRLSFGAATTENPPGDVPIIAYTPSAAPCSASAQAVASLAVGTDNKVWIAWCDVNGALHCTSWVYTPGAGGAKGTFGAATDEVVSAANGVVRRFRGIDLDLAGATNPIIACYEALASNWIGAEVRVYCRRNDNTWQRIIAWGLFGQNQIMPYSEDVSIAWHADGIVSNVGKFLLYWAATANPFDQGDTIAEWSFNVSTGSTATRLGTWFTTLDVNQAKGARRGWIYKLTTGANGMWLMARVVGSSVPKFWASKLTTGKYGPPLISSYQPSYWAALTNDMRIDTSYDARVAVGCNYADNRLVFGFLGYSKYTSTGRMFREVMFRYNSITDWGYAFVDAIPRPLEGMGDTSHSHTTPAAIYGGDNSRLTASPGQFNWVTVYPAKPGENYVEGSVHNVAEDVPGLVTIMEQSDTVTTDRPNFRVSVEADDIPPAHYAKVQVQCATDMAMTQNVRTATEPDSSYRYLANMNGKPQGIVVITVPGTLLDQPLYTHQWYWRARLITDKGQYGPWTPQDSELWFNVTHPPVTTPTGPKSDSVIDYADGNVTFTWHTTDTEPTDSQAAYNVVIQTESDGTTVVDTGWVTSSTHSATIAIPVASKDTVLTWKVRAQDKDGAQGDFCTPVRFVAGQKPDTAITSPSGGQTALNSNTDFESETVGVSDAFNRTVSGSWGNADTGQAWSLLGGTAANFDVNGSVGRHIHTSVSVSRETRLTTVSKQNFDYTLGPITNGGLPVGNNVECGLVGRLNGNTYVDCRVFWTTANIATIVVRHMNNGTETYSSFVQIPGATGTSQIMVRFVAYGDLLMAKGWVAGNAEPEDWTVVLQVPSVLPAGAVSIKSQLDTGNTNTLNYIFTFEDLKIADPPANWTGFSSGIARDKAYAHGGASSLIITSDGTASYNQAFSEAHATKQGVDYFGRVWVRSESSYTGGIKVAFNWSKSDGTYLSTTVLQNNFNVPAATWTLLSGSAKPPTSDSQKVNLVVQQDGIAASGVKFRADDAVLGVNQLTTAMPTFTWSYTGYGSRTQRSFRVIVTDLTTGVVVGDSLWQASDQTSYSFADQILQNDSAYNVTVYVQDTGGLQNQSSTTFVTSWIHPAQPTFSLSQDGFKTTVTWDGAAQDGSFVAWRVWRRYQKPALLEMDFDDTANVWFLVAEITDSTVTEFKDYRTPLNKPVEYTVTQIADRFGSVIDSFITTTATITCASDRYYFVPENLVGTIASYEAGMVTADSFTDEIEQETIHVIGRGRQVQVGDDLGYSGSLTIKLRNASSARADREFLEYLSSSNTNNVYLRSPFGDVLLVKLGSLSFSRLAGIGATDGSGNIVDLGDLTVPYSEVISNEVNITRAS